MLSGLEPSHEATLGKRRPVLSTLCSVKERLPRSFTLSTACRVVGARVQRRALNFQLSTFCAQLTMQTVRGERESAAKCSGANRNHQQQA